MKIKLLFLSFFIGKFLFSQDTINKIIPDVTFSQMNASILEFNFFVGEPGSITKDCDGSEKKEFKNQTVYFPNLQFNNEVVKMIVRFENGIVVNKIYYYNGKSQLDFLNFLNLSENKFYEISDDFKLIFIETEKINLKCIRQDKSIYYEESAIVKRKKKKRK